MDPKTQALTAVELLQPLVNNTSVDQLDNQTPCSEWKVRDLLNHVIGGGHMFAAGLRGDPVSGDGSADLVGDDHKASFQGAVDSLGAALEATDDLNQIVVLPFGTMPAVIALQVAAGDLLVHCWDLSQATGQSFDPPIEFVEASYGFFQMAVNDDMRAAGMFAPAVPAPDDAPPLTKLLMFAGRQP
ncbi:MAG TPA: TIGR03086 family metal-binding protein [Acidimicrobiales bacterium]